MWLIIIVFLQLPAKEGFPVIRVICHESVIYVTGHVSHRSEAQGLLPRITRQLVHLTNADEANEVQENAESPLGP